MSDFDLITSVNTLLKESAEQPPVEGNTEPEYNKLSDEEVTRLVDFIREDLTEDGLQDDRDAVVEKACTYLEDIPGLEIMRHHADALKSILDKYFGT
jgi:hypothetical protein